MYYHVYKDIRDGAWQCLIDAKICRLPVDVLCITRKLGIRVRKDSEIQFLSHGEYGRSFYDGKAWIIVYDDKNSSEISRFTIAHELGHCLLAHAALRTKSIAPSAGYHLKSAPRVEEQANNFARRLLCPSCVLLSLGLTTPELIAQYCNVERRVACERAKRLQVLCKRDKFLSSTLERTVQANFKAYITEELEKQKLKGRIL